MKKVNSFLAMCDPSTRDHQKRVSILASYISMELALPLEQIKDIRTIGLIHDIGKVCLPPAFMAKTDKLSPSERMLVRKHPQVGFDLLNDSDLSDIIKQSVLQHHERIDGSGYPNQLIGDQILLEAKVVTVADVVDAIISDRLYNPHLDINDAINEITINKGLYYDSTVVDATLGIFPKTKQYANVATATIDFLTQQPKRCYG